MCSASETDSSPKGTPGPGEAGQVDLAVDFDVVAAEPGERDRFADFARRRAGGRRGLGEGDRAGVDRGEHRRGALGLGDADRAQRLLAVGTFDRDDERAERSGLRVFRFGFEARREGLRSGRRAGRAVGAFGDRERAFGLRLSAGGGFEVRDGGRRRAARFGRRLRRAGAVEEMQLELAEADRRSVREDGLELPVFEDFRFTGELDLDLRLFAFGGDVEHQFGAERFVLVFRSVGGIETGGGEIDAALQFFFQERRLDG